MRPASGLVVGLLLVSGPCMAQDKVKIPPCALSGAPSVMIGGQPALRLSDVANCPPSLYDILPSIQIEGLPVVHFKPGAAEATVCGAGGEASVTLEGKAASRLGDVVCTTE
jgi:uncharacterized Zn-binding protein involved in type VI secretion